MGGPKIGVKARPGKKMKMDISLCNGGSIQGILSEINKNVPIALSSNANRESIVSEFQIKLSACFSDKDPRF